MPRKLIGLQFILALAGAVSGCSNANKDGDDREVLQVRLRDVGHLYNEYLSKYQKPPMRAEDLEELVDQTAKKRFNEIMKEGRIIVIWNAAPRDQEGNSDTYVLAYETNPAPSGKRWVYRAKRGTGIMANRWLPNESTVVELTTEEFEKAPRAKPSS